MIELDGMTEEELVALLDDLALRKRNVAFAGGKVLSKGGMGTLAFPFHFGPVVGHREIATVGVGYSIPGEDHGQPCCPHMCSGTIEQGAQDVVFQGRPVVMVGHKGSHWPSCGAKRAPAVVVEGWKVAYWSGRDYGL
jgi:hypothetical protein